MTRWAVVLAGGVGSRFWPLSTPALPKQLLPLADDRPLLEGTLARLAPAVPVERTLILTSESLVDATLLAIPSLKRENIIAEPRAAGTAAALTWAAREVLRRGGADDTMLCVHADWFIADEEEFRSTLDRAAGVAETNDCLVTVGIVPTRADPGFGYIQRGEEIAGAGSATRVAQFVEKPDRANAARMVAEGYLWNSGIFVWKANRFLEEVRAHTPEVSLAMEKHSERLGFFADVKSISVDVGVLERSGRVAVIAGDFGWDDVGTWAALIRVLPRDGSGNAVRGKAYALDSHNNVVFGPKTNVVLYGVNDLVVVCHDGVTLVTTVERAADLKTLVEALPSSMRSA